jgi:hypothetical protein
LFLPTRLAHGPTSAEKVVQMRDFIPGDIVEMETPRGFAYAQVSHDHPSYPQVVRVFDRIFDRRIDDTDALVRLPVQFLAMISLAAVLERKRCARRLVGNVPVSEPFPVFRTPVRGKQGEIIYCWLWDGRSLSIEADVAGPHQNAPLREVMGVGDFWDRLAQLDQRTRQPHDE